MNWNTRVEAGQGHQGYCDWVELEAESDVLLAQWSLSDDPENPAKWRFPDDIQLLAGQQLVVFADGFAHRLHSNFKLKPSGEWIGLFRPDGSMVDSLRIPFIGRDYAYGLQPETGLWGWYDVPTPGAPNTTDWYQGVAPAPVFVLAPGYYQQSQQLVLQAVPGATVRYTRQGAPVLDNSPVYGSPIDLSSTSVIQAQAFLPGYLPSPVVVQSYWINEVKPRVPTLSLTTDPANLWDNMMGIYVTGSNGVKGNGPASDPPRNWNRDWERECVLEYVDSSLQYRFQQQVGIKIFGGWSRAFAQKSLAVFARKDYGSNQIDYPFFSETALPQAGSFILRNSGNDWTGAGGTMLRDAFQQALTVGRMDIDHQAYQPTVLYLNGSYWGIHNQREKLNEDYLYHHHLVNPDEVDLLSNNRELMSGNARRYNELASFVQSHPISFPSNFEQLRRQMDLREFMDYQILQIFINNQDWPGNNIKYWRAHAPGSRWRWMLFDTDFGFGIWNFSPADNTLAFATQTNGPGWPNPPWSTLLLRSLIEHPGFKTEFAQRYLSHLNYAFEPDRVISMLDSLAGNLDPAIQRHLTHWGGQDYFGWIRTLDRMRSFAQTRPYYARQHLQQRFALGRNVQLRLWWPDEQGGSVQENDYRLHHLDGGTYLSGLPLALQAVPQRGYEFLGWERFAMPSDTLFPQGNGRLYPSSRLEIKLDSNSWVAPRFVPLDVKIRAFTLPASPNASSLTLYNPTDQTQFLGGYHFTGSIDTVLAPGTQLAAGESLTLRLAIPADSFSVLLRHPAGQMLDSLTYVSGYWPGGTDFQLLHPQLNNAFATNWQSVPAGGTPHWQSWQGDLKINEIMADNQSGIRDESGAFADWLELYNPSERGINLGGMYLSDDPARPFRWQIPDHAPFQTTIAPRGYLRLWADGDSADGPLHLPFALSKAGERLYLFEAGGLLLDSISFPALMADVAYARLPDGGSDWEMVVLQSSSPAGPNKADNQPPVFVSPPVLKALPESFYRYEALTEDPNRDQIWQEALAIPQWAQYIAYESGQGSIRGTPQKEDIGEHLVVLRCWDGYTQSYSVQTFTIVVEDPAEARIQAMEQGIVFPNPSGGQLTYLANLAPNTALQFRLMDVAGREVWTESFRSVISPWRQELDLSQLSKGMYLLQVWENETLRDWHKLVLE